MKFHPLSEIFPLIDGPDYDSLVEDIKANGLHEPIWVYENMVLDGRNRWRACKDAKIEPRTREYRGSDALGFVVSLNLKRRHLSESQRGMVGARIANMEAHRPVSDKSANLPTSQVSQSSAAEKLNVSARTIRTAKQVIERGTPELVKAVDSGKMPVSVAARLTKATPEKQREVAKEFETKATATELKAHVALATGENEWYTPPEYIEAAREVMDCIDCDPASSKIANKTVRAGVFFSQDEDGLTRKWTGNVWMNPPYSQPLISQFADAVASKYESGEISAACVLVNNATETSWFQKIAERGSAICFPKSRIKFLNPEGNPVGAPLQGQAIIYLGESPDVFCRTFQKFGTTWRR